MLLTGMKDVYHLPCAGITLIRFYGFDLSLPSSTVNTPGNAEIFTTNVRDKIF